MVTQVHSTVIANIPGGVRDPQALMRLQRPVAFPIYEELRDGTTEFFTGLSGYVGPVPITVAGDDRDDRFRVWAHLATPDYFEVLEISPALGRLFDARERELGAPPVVILSDRLWRTRFGERASIIGDAIRINGQVATVIGVTPRGFAGPAPMSAAAELWIPSTVGPQVAPELSGLRNRDLAMVAVIGRLATGVSDSQAEGALDTVRKRIELAHGEPTRAPDEPRLRLLPGGRMFPVRTEDLPRAIGFPLVLVSLVLIMACGNVANLVLARGASRHREFATRLALGAGAGRVVRQLLTESLLLSVLGSIAGALVAGWLLSLFEFMRPLLPGYVHYEVRFDWTAYAVAAGLSSLATMVFSLAPALNAGRQDLQTSLKPVAPPSFRARRRFGLRNLVIYQQVTVSVVLVLLTSFIVVGWRRAATVDVGFVAEHLYFLSIDPVRDGHSAGQAFSITERLRDRLQLVTGITAVSIAQTVPLSMSGTEVVLEARTNLATGATSLGSMRTDRVGTGFFETLGIPLLRGRGFVDSDLSDESRAVVVSQTMARTAWPGVEPIGQQLTLENRTWQVVGVARDTRAAFPLAPTLPAVYQPATPSGFAAPARTGVTLAVRTAPGVDGPALITREMRAFDPQLTVVGVKRMTDEIEQAMFLARAVTFVYGGMGVLGLILASVGLAGVTAYAVARRARLASESRSAPSARKCWRWYYVKPRSSSRRAR
jgi:predicted permease